MSNTSDDRSSNCVFPDERSEAEGFNGQFGSERNCQLNLSASQRSGKTHFQGQSTEGGQGVTSGQKRKAGDIEEQINDRKSTNELVGKGKSNNNKIDLSWLPRKIHDWTGRANISFKYGEKKTGGLLKKAKEEMAKTSDCNQLECTQCNELFLSEPELKEHYHSEGHLEKVRERSESSTLGDLTAKFAPMRQFILGEVLSLLPTKQVTSKEQTQAILPPANQASLPAATTEVSENCSRDEYGNLHSITDSFAFLVYSWR